MRVTLLLLLLTITGCRSVNKEWMSNNFASKNEVNDLRVANNLSKSNLNNKIQEIEREKNFEIIEESRKKTTSQEEQKTEVTGQIKGESGVTKQVTIGNTIISSNGATVNFKTNSKTSFSKEDEQRYTAITKELERYSEVSTKLQLEVMDIRSYVQKLEQVVNQSHSVEVKEVKSKGLPIGVVIALIVVGVVALAYFSV